MKSLTDGQVNDKKYNLSLRFKFDLKEIIIVLSMGSDTPHIRRTKVIVMVEVTLVANRHHTTRNYGAHWTRLWIIVWSIHTTLFSVKYPCSRQRKGCGGWGFGSGVGVGLRGGCQNIKFWAKQSTEHPCNSPIPPIYRGYKEHINGIHRKQVSMVGPVAGVINAVHSQEEGLRRITWICCD